MRSGRITQKQIADEAGVSQMTVSNVLKGRSEGKVSPETCRRIQKIIAKYDYGMKLTPNAVIYRKAAKLNRIILLKATDDKTYMKIKDLDSVAVTVTQDIRKAAVLTAKKYGIPLEFKAISKINSPVEIDWMELEDITKDDAILVDSIWNLHAAVALQKRGCRVAMLTDELFWLHYYAPQLSRFAMFVKEENKTMHQVVSFLISSGAKNIAVQALLPYYYEPENPIRLGYERSMGLHGQKYRNVILIDHRDGHYRAVIQKAWKEKPFDALILGITRLPVPAFDPEKTIHENLGLPENVILFFVNKPFFTVREFDNSYYLAPVQEERVEDAIRVLVSRNYKPGIKYYGRQIKRMMNDER